MSGGMTQNLRKGQGIDVIHPILLGAIPNKKSNRKSTPTLVLTVPKSLLPSGFLFKKSQQSCNGISRSGGEKPWCREGELNPHEG